MTDLQWQWEIEGYCPMGCGSTLVLADSGTRGRASIVCSWARCPNPTAVADLLSERETEHLVTLADDSTFTVQHPLRERVAGGLLSCTVHVHAAELPVASRRPGTYRVRVSGSSSGGDPVWAWERLP